MSIEDDMINDPVSLKDTIPVEWRNYYIRLRQTLIMQLGAIEDLLGIPRSIVPRHKRKTDDCLEVEITIDKDF